MSGSRFPRIVYFLLFILGLLHWAHVYPRLPARMASHFAADGTPNGWLPKGMFFALLFCMLLVSAVVIFLTPRIINSKPPERINLPNKAYWLAPEHCQETYRFITAQMGWFGCGILFALLYGTSQAINANLPDGRFNSQSMFQVMVAFVLLTIGWTFFFIRRFSRVPQSTFPTR
jgi:uncharacterized membrane protein